LLLHGSNLDSRSWDFVIDSLAAAQRVVRMDHRSHGKSVDASGPFSWVDDVVEVLDAVGARQATLVGHSLGAQVALDVALEHPDRIAGLVLVAPAIGGMPLRNPPAGIESLVAALRAGDFSRAGDALAAMPVMRLYADTTRQALVRTMVRENVRLFRARPEWVRHVSPPANQRLESIRVPVLVLMGERDPTESNDAGRELLRRVSGARGDTLQGCGHLVPLDCPSATLAAFGDSGVGGAPSLPGDQGAHRRVGRSTSTHRSLRPYSRVISAASSILSMSNTDRSERCSVSTIHGSTM
jgi:pimeloyl-ACP methyl ester carboxylesterase